MADPRRDRAHEAWGFARALLTAGPYRPASTAALMLAGAVLEGIGLLLLVPLIGLLVPDGAGGRAQVLAARAFAALGLAAPGARLVALLALLALFVAVIAVRAAVLTARDRRLTMIQLQHVERERIGLLRDLGRARWQDIAGLHHARVTSAIGTDIQRVAGAAHYLLQGLVAAVMLAAQWLLTLLIAPALAGIAALLMAAGAALLVPQWRRARRIGDDLTTDYLGLMHASGQFLAGLKAAMAQRIQGAFVDDFASRARSLTARQAALEHRHSAGRIGTASVSALVGAGVLLAGVWLALPIAVLLSGIVILSRMSGPALQLQQAAGQLAALLPAQTSLVALRRDLRPGEAAANDAMPVRSGARGDIRLRGVGYAHRDGGGVADIDLTLRAQEIVGVTGASGAGKTTLLDLVAGLIAPTHGHIEGRPATHAEAGQGGTAYVTQEAFLVHDTLRRNLTLGLPGDTDASEAALWAALDAVDAAGLVRGWAAGLDTLVGERGGRLSGGERQRIALARALLRRPTLLILDEATNAIDVAGETAILARLAARPDRPTMLIVAHRPQSLATCERLLVLEHGRLVADRPAPDRPSIVPPR